MLHQLWGCFLIIAQLWGRFLIIAQLWGRFLIIAELWGRFLIIAELWGRFWIMFLWLRVYFAKRFAELSETARRALWFFETDSLYSAKRPGAQSNFWSLIRWLRAPRSTWNIPTRTWNNPTRDLAAFSAHRYVGPTISHYFLVTTTTEKSSANFARSSVAFEFRSWVEY